jgi:hypothetical protein
MPFQVLQETHYRSYIDGFKNGLLLATQFGSNDKMMNRNRRRVGNTLEAVAKAIFNASTRRSVARLLVLTLALTVGFFLLDLRTSADVIVPFLYLLPMLCVILWTSPHQFLPVIVAALVSTALNALGYVWSKHVGNIEISALNRLLAACVTWGTVVLALLQKGDEKDNTRPLA